MKNDNDGMSAEEYLKYVELVEQFISENRARGEEEYAYRILNMLPELDEKVETEQTKKNKFISFIIDIIAYIRLKNKK